MINMPRPNKIIHTDLFKINWTLGFAYKINSFSRIDLPFGHENALLQDLLKNGSFWKIITTSLKLKISLPNLQGTP